MRIVADIAGSVKAIARFISSFNAESQNDELKLLEASVLLSQT